MKFFVVYIIINICSEFANSTPNLIVKTNYGYIQGSVGKSRNSREFLSFKGIPYAAPPTQGFRFKAPYPLRPWNFTLQADEDGPLCIQLLNATLILGQEDCLYLNIYVPVIENSTKPLPVMIYFHGGSFLIGAGVSILYGADFFMDKDVILVTVNYRLGVFGFLSTLDDNAPGNYGLKDQVFAMQFINKNIKFFGGDRNRVTIFGNSAGSASVDMHMISPLSKNLFKQAIGQSGTALNAWALPNNDLHLNLTLETASRVGCKKYLGNHKFLLKCLRKVAPEILLKKFYESQPFGKELLLPPYLIVSETKTKINRMPFLDKSPFEYIKSGNFKKAPIIYGMVQDEGLVVVSPILRDKMLKKTVNTNFSDAWSDLLYLAGNPGRESLLKNISAFYLANQNYLNSSDPQNIQGFINLITDRFFGYGVYQSVTARAWQGHKNIWLYNFDYRGNYSQFDDTLVDNLNFKIGVGHTDELKFLFRSKIRGNDVKMSQDLIGIWTDFAIFGNPDPKKHLKWKRVLSKGKGNSEKFRFLNITGSFATESIKFKMQKGFHSKGVQFWSRQSIDENMYL